MSWVLLALGIATFERVLLLALAARNTRRLMARGAVEHGRRHYPLFFVLHGAWLAAMLVLVPWATVPQWPVLGLWTAFEGLRFWAILCLGPLWTTRVVTLAGTPLVVRGPYRWLRHPNYVAAAAEIALLPLAFGAWQLALAFSIPNLALLRHRIRVEESALAGRASEPLPPRRPHPYLTDAHAEERETAMEQNLAAKTCVPCRGSIPPLGRAEAERLMAQTPGWKLLDNATRIERSFKFKDFKESLAFTNRVGALAEEEGHHPDITFGWGYSTVSIFTHKIKGLHENDFILAAKINALGAA